MCNGRRRLPGLLSSNGTPRTVGSYPAPQELRFQHPFIVNGFMPQDYHGAIKCAIIYDVVYRAPERHFAAEGGQHPRNAHFLGLLSVFALNDIETATESSGGGNDREMRSRQIYVNSDDRCLFADDRRERTAAPTIHSARQGSAFAAIETKVDSARTTEAAVFT
jgi:hypothetical protein